MKVVMFRKYRLNRMEAIYFGSIPLRARLGPFLVKSKDENMRISPHWVYDVAFVRLLVDDLSLGDK